MAESSKLVASKNYGYTGAQFFADGLSIFSLFFFHFPFLIFLPRIFKLKSLIITLFHTLKKDKWLTDKFSSENEGNTGGKAKAPPYFPSSQSPSPFNSSYAGYFFYFFREREGGGENKYQLDKAAEKNNVHVLKRNNIISWNSSLLVKLLKVYWSPIMGNQSVFLAYGGMLNQGIDLF